MTTYLKQVEEIVNINTEIVSIDLDSTTINAFDLYKWLRVKQKTNHCIFISHHPLSYYLQNFPDESILLLGQGVSFYEKPFDESSIDKAKLSEFDNNSFVRLLTKSINLKKIRHELANKTALIWYTIYLDSIKGNFNLTSLTNTIESNLELSVLNYINPFTTFGLGEERKKQLKPKLNKYKDLKVLCIDDIADWSTFYEKIFKKVQHLNSTNWGEINIKIKAIKPDCIFLDLRLLNEKDEVKPHNLSGVTILHELINNHPEIPIVITSATDDAETIEYVKEKGAYAFWQKKGIDSSFSSQYIKNEFLKLFEIADQIYEIAISIAKKEIFKFQQLKRLKKQEKIESFDKYDLILIDTNFWIKDKIKIGKTTEKIVFAELLFKIYTLCRNYIKRKISDMEFELEGKIYTSYNPHKYKVVITNETLSELLKLSKNVFGVEENKESKETAYRSSFALEIIKELLSEDKLLIANYFKNTNDSSAYADPYILDYISANLLGRNNQPKSDTLNFFTFENGNNNEDYKKYKSENLDKLKVSTPLVLTNDFLLSEKIKLYKGVKVINIKDFLKVK